MLKNYLIKVSGILLCVTCLGTNIYAGVLTDSTAKSTDETAAPKLHFVEAYLKSVRLKSTLKPSEFGYEGDKKIGLFKNEINVAGVVRFLTIFRNMGDAYSDMTTAKRNISFQDQAVGGAGATAGGGYPALELTLSSKISKTTDFNVGYSFNNLMNGNSTNNQASPSTIQNMQQLRVGGTFNTALGKFSFQGGSILPVKLTKFTMGQPNYRDDYFDRLPWDWYRNTFLRHEEYYTLKMNMGGQNEGRTLFYGLTMGGNIIPLGLNFTALYGRSSQTAPYAAQLGGFFPSILYGGRIEKALFTKDVNGKYGINHYNRRADVDNFGGLPDNNSMTTVDATMQFKGVKIVTEVAYSRIDNPTIDNVKTHKGRKFGDIPVMIPILNSGLGFQLKADITRKILPIPLEVEAYWIEKNVVSFDGSILNTNSNFRTSGIATENRYDANLFNNLVQEIGQYANNRKGVTLKTNFKLKKLTVDLGLMITEEIENINDSTITIQHRVNSFSRSRFKSFYMEGGPYSRIRSVFRRSYENIAITQGNGGLKKSFNAAEIMLMYKAKLFGKDFVLMNYHTYNTALSHINIMDNFNDNAYSRLYYTDATAVIRVFKKVSIIGNYGFEKLLGGKNTIKDELTNKTINQIGYNYGVGIDYDFLSTAGLHLRHKYFSHYDTNFVLDKFNGTETTLELKLFF
jgi:hypothetical protein